MTTNAITVTTPAPAWTGRTDGTTVEHLRWHQAVEPYTPDTAPGACVFIGFASDEGVERNKGRRGAAAGPDALRGALSSMALAEPIRAYDAGTVTVAGNELEDAQETLGAAVGAALDAGQFPVVLGGGHEVAYGTYLGLARSAIRTPDVRVGIVNLDAHFDLRNEPVAEFGHPVPADPGTGTGSGNGPGVFGDRDQPAQQHRGAVRHRSPARCALPARRRVLGARQRP